MRFNDSVQVVHTQIWLFLFRAVSFCTGQWAAMLCRILLAGLCSMISRLRAD